MDAVKANVQAQLKAKGLSIEDLAKNAPLGGKGAPSSKRAPSAKQAPGGAKGAPSSKRGPSAKQAPGGENAPLKQSKLQPGQKHATKQLKRTKIGLKAVAAIALPESTSSDDLENGELGET
jgi:hypothetical protein